MPPVIKLILLLVFFSPLLGGCSYLGMENHFKSDPLTGGVNTSTSNLLGVAVPPGMQVYPSHSYSSMGANGTREGLETYRGNVDGQAAAMYLFNTLKAAGWQLRLSLRKGDRSLYLYQKGNDRAVISFHRQGMLTILEIWRGTMLPDGADISEGADYGEGPDISLPGEEYGPIDEKNPTEGTVEKWGGNSSLEEREL